MSNSDKKDEVNGIGCIYATLIPLVIFLIGMVLSIATGGTTDSLLNIDTSEYPSKIFYGFWFLVVAVVVVYILNNKDNKSEVNPTTTSYRNHNIEDEYLDLIDDSNSPDSDDSPQMEMYDPEDDVDIIGNEDNSQKTIDDINIEYVPDDIDKNDTQTKTSSYSSSKNLDQNRKEQNSNFPFCEDSQGNKYRYVDIGEISWCIDNFKGKQFLDGEEIQEAQNIKDWIQSYKDGIPAFYEHSTNSNNNYEIIYNYYVLGHKNLATNSFDVPKSKDINEFNNSINSFYLDNHESYQAVQRSLDYELVVNIENAKIIDQYQEKKFWVVNDKRFIETEKLLIKAKKITGRASEITQRKIPSLFCWKHPVNTFLSIDSDNIRTPGFIVKLCKSNAIKNRLMRL